MRKKRVLKQEKSKQIENKHTLPNKFMIIGTNENTATLILLCQHLRIDIGLAEHITKHNDLASRGGNFISHYLTSRRRDDDGDGLAERLSSCDCS
jgi:hypothetical protein